GTLKSRWGLLISKKSLSSCNRVMCSRHGGRIASASRSSDMTRLAPTWVGHDNIRAGFFIASGFNPLTGNPDDRRSKAIKTDLLADCIQRPGRCLRCAEQQEPRARLYQWKYLHLHPRRRYFYGFVCGGDDRYRQNGSGERITIIYTCRHVWAVWMPPARNNILLLQVMVCCS